MLYFFFLNGANENILFEHTVLINFSYNNNLH